MPPSYVTVEEAIGLPGLRVAFTQGVPGPWGEAVKAFLAIKGIAFTPVIQEGGQPNEALVAWTGQNSAPVAVLDDERPRAHWSELLLLTERLRPEPRLVPADEDDRTLMFGIAHALCGEDGFGWSARLLTFEAIQSTTGGPMDHMKRKFASGASLDHAMKRCASIMAMLARRLETGCPYLVGDAFSAADIYWTVFSNMVAPMDAAACPMPDYYRLWTSTVAGMLEAPVPEVLIAHREWMLRDHFHLPLWL
jgi:glutathione S-transferase